MCGVFFDLDYIEMIDGDYRQKKRRRIERRLMERRSISFPFGSDEWCQLIKKNYLLWPKIDRRNLERRNLMRRKGCRRLNVLAIRKQTFVNNRSFHDLLSEGEKNMLFQIAQSEDID